MSDTAETPPLDRLGQPARLPRAVSDWSVSTLVPPGALAGANGMRWGLDGELYVAQAFGSQISAVDPETGTARIVSGADGQIIAPDDLAFDSHGNLFATEVMNAQVSAIRPDGSIDVIAADVPVANGVTVHDDRIFMSEFNPEGRIWELFADGSQPRVIASGLMMPNALCLGPDGYLYFPLVPLGEVWRVSAEGGEAERVIGGLDIPTAVKFDAHGRLFAVESGTGSVVQIDAAGGSRSDFAQVAYGIDNFAFAPDGRMFVSHFTDGEIVEISPEGTQRIAVAGTMCGPFGLAATASGGLAVADGMSLALVDRDGAIVRPSMLLQHGFPGYVRGVAMAADGAFIVSNSGGQVMRYRPGEEAHALCDGLDQAMGLAVAGDGTIYVCEAGGGRVLAIGADGDVRNVADGLDRPTGIALAADGGLLVSEAGAGRLVHIAGGAKDTVLSGLGEPHGVAVNGQGIFVLDRGTGALIRVDDDGEAQTVIVGLPVGGHSGMRQNVLPGIRDLMPGPLLPFADLAAVDDATIAVGGDQSGTILMVSRGPKM